MIDVSTAIAPLMVVAFSLADDQQAQFDRFYSWLLPLKSKIFFAISQTAAPPLQRAA